MSVRAILSTLEYKIKKDAENELWRKYMASAVQTMSNNIVHFIGGQLISDSYGDLINPKPIDNRSADEIINSIKNKIEKINS